MKTHTHTDRECMTHSVFISKEVKDASPMLEEQWICSIRYSTCLLNDYICNTALLFGKVLIVVVITHTHTEKERHCHAIYQYRYYVFGPDISCNRKKNDEMKKDGNKLKHYGTLHFFCSTRFPLCFNLFHFTKPQPFF